MKSTEKAKQLVKVVKIKKDFEFVQFINIGNNKTAVMLNNPKTNQIRYILISRDEYY